MTIRNIKKNLAGMEDLLQGLGTEEQARGNSTYTLGKVDVPYAVDSLAKMTALDITLWTRARVYTDTTTFVDYIFDPLASAGVAPDAGAGYWILNRTKVLAFDTLADAVANTGLSDGDVISLKERTTGNGGGAMWDVVLSSTVVENAYNIVQCTGVGTLSLVLRVDGEVYVAQFGAKCDGVTDDSAAVNATILFAYKNKRVALLDQDETWSPTVKWPTGVDCHVLSSILLPSGVILEFNGSRVTGDNASAGTSAYSTSGLHLLRTAYYDSGTDSLIKNTDLSLNVKRLVGSQIRNVTLAFANCAIDAHNMNEQSILENVRFSQCSRALRLKACFYLTVRNLISRDTATIIGHQAIELFGNDNNSITFSACAVVGAGIGYSLSGTANFAIAWTDGCSFEESKSVNGIGIYSEVGSYVSGVNIEGSYIEGVTTFLHVEGGLYGVVVSGNIFNNNQHALLTQGAGASIRHAKWIGNSVPDGGGTDRNLINTTDGSNGVEFQIPDISGAIGALAEVPSNITYGKGSGTDAKYHWLSADSSNQLGTSTLPNGALNDLIMLPYAGRGGVTLANEPPFAVVSRSGDDILVTTAITHDELNMLAFSFYGNSTNVAWDVKGIVLSDLVEHFTAAGFTLTLNTPVAGSDLVVRITRDVGDFGAVVNLSGAIRHL